MIEGVNDSNEGELKQISIETVDLNSRPKSKIESGKEKRRREAIKEIRREIIR